jgi:hypothetical protein
MGAKAFRITKFGRKPRTARAALVQARNLLAEEGRWVKGTAVMNEHALVSDGPTCGSWGACAVGALGLVTGNYEPIRDHDGAIWFEFHSDTNDVYRAAEHVLHVVAREGGHTSIVALNDAAGTTRDDVLGAFDKAIELAGKRQLMGVGS